MYIYKCSDIRFQRHHFSLRYLELCCLFARSQFSVNTQSFEKHRAHIHAGMILTGINHRNIAQMFRFFAATMNGARNTPVVWENYERKHMMNPLLNVGIRWFDCSILRIMKMSNIPYRQILLQHTYLLIRFTHPHRTS